MPIDKEELVIMTARTGNRIQLGQNELQKYQKLVQRLNLLNKPEQVNQFGDKLSPADLEKHFIKAKAEFDKLFTATKNK